ncbi:TPA: BCCT family transporter [Photobacterium damselae]
MIKIKLSGSKNWLPFFLYGGILLSSCMFLLFPNQAVFFLSNISNKLSGLLAKPILITVSLVVILCLILALFPIGKTRLGDSPPDYSYFSWVTMVFTTGMGSGLVFWGIAEPAYHYLFLPNPAVIESHRVSNVLAITYFHWGIHAWAIYAIVAVSYAWFRYIRNRDLSLTSPFIEQSKGSNLFKIINIIAVFTIIFSVAGAFANSVSLIQDGLNLTANTMKGFSTRIIIVILISLFFCLSSFTSIKKGIRTLSLLNIMLMLTLAVTVFFTNDVKNILHIFIRSIKDYILLLPKLSFQLNEKSQQWSVDWTINYFIWWCAWAPFVGIFLAKISKGRTVRQFVLSVIFIPTLTSIIWFSIYSGSALTTYSERVLSATKKDFTYGLFAFYEQLPFSTFLSVSSILLLSLFIITSIDSSVNTINTLIKNDKRRITLLYCLLISLLTIILIYYDDINLNKQIAIIGAIPFMLIIVSQIYAFIVDIITFTFIKNGIKST